MTSAAFALIVLLAPQEGSLDVLDGETLYEHGWLFTLGIDGRFADDALDGRDEVTDPFGRRLREERLSLAAHFGIRNDVQLSAILPFEFKQLERDLPGGGHERVHVEGFGDACIVAKWRYLRLDGPGWTCNFAVLGGLELPTGETDERATTGRLDPEFQPGSGSWDPSIGTAVTHEPGRWRFNAAVLAHLNTEGAHDYRFGNRVFGELAVGNRFWLEPYPGPFMRFDAFLRFRHVGRDHDDGDLVTDSGGDLATVGGTLAFRPQPVLDFQISVEVPVYERRNGLQLEEGITVFFVFGFRI